MLCKHVNPVASGTTKEAAPLCCAPGCQKPAMRRIAPMFLNKGHISKKLLCKTCYTRLKSCIRSGQGVHVHVTCYQPQEGGGYMHMPTAECQAFIHVVNTQLESGVHLRTHHTIDRNVYLDTKYRAMVPRDPRRMCSAAGCTRLADSTLSTRMTTGECSAKIICKLCANALAKCVGCWGDKYRHARCHSTGAEGRDKFTPTEACKARFRSVAQRMPAGVQFVPTITKALV